ncbi:MAG: hypothetical protein ACE15B_17130 [Bryobacteraceae bacterium]
MSVRREWGIRAALALLSPIALLTVLELVLRAGGAGFPSAFFLRVPGRDVRMPNCRFGERFFPNRLALGAVLARRARFKEAAEHFRAALKLRPDLVAARANLERVLREEGR